MSRDLSLLFESLAEQFAQQLRAGSTPDIERFAHEHPELAERIRSLFPVLQMMEQQQLSEMIDESELLEEELKQLNKLRSVDVSDRSIDDLSEDRRSNSSEHQASDLHELPQRIGRYRIEKVLGKGSFGLVYLAHDEQLNRPVAVKVPHAKLIAKPEDAEAYLLEARTVANLDHPAIVPVHDVGGTEDFPCYIVSKYIEGTDLLAKLKQHRLKYREAAELVATVAEALHYAHKQGIVHRDIKPSNILIGNDGQPYVVDFGLALREENIGKGPKYAGTPMYMSPEQARGEGHRVDGRSDIFSLGVVFYELLAGRRPFRGETRAELFKRVTRYEARPLRQYDDNIPKELERICHKALAKRALERYFIAKDFAEDLRLFLQEESAIQSSKSLGSATSAPTAMHSAKRTSVPLGSIAASSASINLGSSDSPPVRIVPKGLRSFDAHDADFFLELLPGPRDREGLPDSLRFWKTRIEEMDADNTFAVGLIYGPSGCGKSSLVKAGLLPRLSENVIPVYLEATAKETESRLLHGLRKRCPTLEDHFSLKDDPSLKDLLATLRRGQGIPDGTKVLIVLDQFEQWLHAKKEEVNPELVQALRQCDGGRLQCIVMVRDDFWLAVSRFLRELEIRLVEGQNSALADLFDRDHARKVLAAFGRAFGKLPENINDTTMEQKAFLQQAVAGLAEEGKVICVRLALFAEMMKGKTWTLASLKEVGGTAGVGVTFLDETFSASTSPPQHRYHQKAARTVLKELLPSSGTEIKGTMRSHIELLEASGYGSRPRDFEDLIRILDSEVRLITPTDPEGVENGEVRSAKKESQAESRQASDSRQTSPCKLQTSFFQLTHDYLVPSLRDWLTRKQKETPQGRAELKLFDTSMTWNSKPENRFLPTWWDHLNIRLLTDKKKWTDSQRRMMDRAGRVHGLRSSVVLLVLLGFVVMGSAVRAQVAKQQEATRIKGLVAQLLSAEPNQIPEIVSQLEESPKVAEQLLAPLLATPTETPDQQRALLHARLASVARDSSLVKELQEELLTNRVTYVGPIRELLTPYASGLRDDFVAVLRDERAPSERRFAAALALADYIPESEPESWTEPELTFVAEQLLTSNAEFQPALRKLLRPIQRLLLPNLERVFENSQATEAQRLSAANAIADYAASDLGRMSQLLAVATPEQYAVLYPLVAASPTPTTVIEDLGQIAAALPPEALGSVERIFFGQRRANAAVTLLRMGERERVLPVFDWSDDPEALTQFIFRCEPRGIGVETLIDLLETPARGASEGRSSTTSTSTDGKPLANASSHDRTHARYALLLAIGEYSPSKIPPSRRAALVEQLADWYANDPSSDVHGAAGWLLRHLGEQEIVDRVDQTPIPYSSQRDWFTLAITVTPTSPATPEIDPKKGDASAEDDAADGAGATAESSTGDQPENFRTDEQPREATPNMPQPAKTFYYTFVVFPPGEYTIGSPDDEPERSKQALRELCHTVKLTRPFALLDREITMEELIAFKPKYHGFMQQYKAQPTDAGFAVDWYDSVAFCRWLGEQMGLPESDQPYASPESLDKEKYQPEPDPEANWAPRNWPLELDRRGFRLPTEAEWEIASRCGARTAYEFGGDALLQERFGWFLENSGKQVHPAKKLRPSSRGLFDLGGNVFEWTHNWYSDYGVEAVTDPLGSAEGSVRVFRGGGWFNAGTFFRSACRDMAAPTYRSVDIGFRVACFPSTE